MADGITHARASMILALPTSAVVWSQTGRVDLAALSAVGCVAGVFLSPDLDIDHKTISETMVYTWFGRIVGDVWAVLWWPYAKLIPHRHPLSHFPFLGTAGRLGYIWLFLLPFQLHLPLTEEALWLYAGLALSDLLHWMMDGFPLFGIDEKLGLRKKPRRRKSGTRRR